MRLSIRTKILGGFFAVIILFLAIIINIALTQKSIAGKLAVINEDYLPKLSMVNNLSNYYHLDESFDVGKMIQNKSKPLILQSFGQYHPRLFNNQLGEIERSIGESGKGISANQEKRYLSLVLKSIDDVKKKHVEYKNLIDEALLEIKDNKIDEAASLNDQLLKKKVELKSEISFLRRRLDNGIKSGLTEVSKMEKNASIITGALSLLAILIAGTIALFALFTLAPIRKLIAGVKKISEGDYNFRFEIKSEGEIKTLAEEFNNMSQSILDRNNALKEQQKKLLQSERMAIVGRMASHITHEVKNPLNSMSLNSELLEDELNHLKGIGNTDEAFSLLGSIRKEIERLSVISEEYLGYSRLPKGDKQTISVETTLKELIALIKSELAKNSIELEENYERGLPEIVIDLNQLKQALLNIIKNAIEAMGTGGKIKISASKNVSKVKISITDNGKGIPPEIIDRIFDPFFSTKVKGTGLGLPLTQKIITEQGGEIFCKSTSGIGTTFEILFPLKSENKFNA